jgi:hypothetical protein
VYVSGYSGYWARLALHTALLCAIAGRVSLRVGGSGRSSLSRDEPCENCYDLSNLEEKREGHEDTEVAITNSVARAINMPCC